jgi:hypothetical protein
MDLLSPGARRLGVAFAAALLSTATLAGVSLADSGTITVTGGSVSAIRITIPDTTAAFGTNLTPDGVASNSGEATAIVDGANPSTGACYSWAGGLSVKSNQAYKLTFVTPTAGTANANVHFMTAAPTLFANCTGGAALSTTTPGTVVNNLTSTNGRAYSFWLGLVMLWTDAPSATFGDATLTVTASAAP